MSAVCFAYMTYVSDVLCAHTKILLLGEKSRCWKVSYTWHELLLWFPKLRGSYGNYQPWLLSQEPALRETKLPQWVLRVDSFFSPVALKKQWDTLG